MDLFIILGLLAFITCMVMPWVNHFRINALRGELDHMRSSLGVPQPGLLRFENNPDAPVPVEETVPAAFVRRTYEDDSAHEDEPVREAIAMQRMAAASLAAPASDPVTDSMPERAAPRRNGFEFDIGTKLPVWTGALSLICAAFFLIKYSIDAGWFGPVTRDLLCGLFGFAMVAAAQWTVKRGHIANNLRIAQGLAGAGIVTLYFCFYAAVNLHHLLLPLAGFGGMAAVTALAVILSLRHGQPIAAFGLIGGLLTPALVGSNEPNAVALFSYLFLLFGGVLTVLSRRGWWTMAGLALAGLFVWTGFWYLFAFDGDDAFAAVVFIMAVCGAVLAATRACIMDAARPAADARPAHGLNILAIAGGAATIMALSCKLELSLFDWSMLGVLSLGCIALAWFRPAVYKPVAFIKMGADLLLFAMLAHGMPVGNAMTVLAGMALLYVALPACLMRRVHDPRPWAGMQASSSVALYLIAYFFIRFPDAAQPGLWGGIGLALAALAAGQASGIRMHYQADDRIKNHLIALYAFASTAFISLGFAIELPWQWLPLAFAAQMAAAMWIGRMTGIGFMRTIAAVLCAVFIGLNYEQLWLFATLAVSSFTEQPVRFLDQGIVLHPMIRLVLPALMTMLALILHRRDQSGNDRLSHLLFGVTLALALDAAYILTRILFHQTVNMPAGFMERGVITAGLAGCALAIVYYARLSGQDFLTIWGKGLFHLALLRIVWFDLLVHNPFFDGTQFVGNWPVVNGVTMVYGTGALLAAWAARNELWAGIDGPARKAYKAFGFALLFTLVSLSVRQAFHGGILATGGESNGEFYTYSFAWLLMGLGLLTVGIVRNSKTARVASLAFLLLTVAKVFLLDAAQLEGLYRIFSFLGLGLSLIGLSFFYTRFILKGREQDDEEERTGPWWF